MKSTEEFPISEFDDAAADRARKKVRQKLGGPLFLRVFPSDEHKAYLMAKLAALRAAKESK